MGRAGGEYESVTRFADLAGTTKVGSTLYGYDDKDRITGIRHCLPGGFYRRFWAEHWPAHVYGQRWQIESHFSMHKRLLGSALRARRRLAQDQEIFLRVLALNLMIVCWTLLRFLQSRGNSISTATHDPTTQQVTTAQSAPARLQFA